MSAHGKDDPFIGLRLSEYPAECRAEVLDLVVRECRFYRSLSRKEEKPLLLTLDMDAFQNCTPVLRIEEKRMCECRLSVLVRGGL